MENKDLVWDLDVFKKRQRAQDFVMGFENQLCVYSGSVEQLYTNYNIFFPKEENRKLVILPNPYAHHDTLQGIIEDAVRPTGLFIVPADKNDVESKRLNIILPLRTASAKGRAVPLEVGLNLINQKRPADKPFLPVLVKGDLRELNAETPCLHLHMINLVHLPKLSAIEVKDIERVVLERLESLAARR
ncbi:hypothetical protein [Teredinibacter haidensis]|uniref:hypothetical protein n=1 Tax=Teredinibacter haidensis TaxID=2731755 RepID=UPI000948D45A|nr:hypothetical protein [Teredinibacter haidensis]